MRAQLEAWQEHYGEEVFKVVFCVGSRWANVHWGVKTRGKGGEEYTPPPVPDGFNDLKHAEQVSLCHTNILNIEDLFNSYYVLRIVSY